MCFAYNMYICIFTKFESINHESVFVAILLYPIKYQGLGSWAVLAFFTGSGGSVVFPFSLFWSILSFWQVCHTAFEVINKSRA